MTQPQTTQKSHHRTAKESTQRFLGTHTRSQLALPKKLSADLTEAIENRQHQKGKEYQSPLQPTETPQAQRYGSIQQHGQNEEARRTGPLPYKDTQQLYRTANDDKQGQPAEPGRLQHHNEDEQVND